MSPDEITYIDELICRSRGPQAITEASLGRAYQHYLKSGEGSWAILTAYRDAGNPEKKKENEAKQKELVGAVRGKGLGFFELTGIWPEDQGGETVTVKEPSLFVPGLNRQDAEELRARYHQDAVIYAGPDTGGEVLLLTASGSRPLGKFHPGRVGDAYSTLKGKAFRFESKPTGFLGNYLRELQDRGGLVEQPGEYERFREALTKIIDGEDDLVEMSNAQPEDSGLRFIVHIFSNVDKRARHGPRIKVYPGSPAAGDATIIAFDETTARLLGQATIPTADVQAAIKFVELNREVLLRYWSDEKYSSKTMMNDLKPIT